MNTLGKEQEEMNELLSKMSAKEIIKLWLDKMQEEGNDLSIECLKLEFKELLGEE